MTDQSPNDLFHASSFLLGHNAEYIEQLYARYATDPTAVDEAWQQFFRQLGVTEVDAKRDAAGPSWARADWPPVPNDDRVRPIPVAGQERFWMFAHSSRRPTVRWNNIG